MPVKYVCLSDMHLGEEDSILTNLSNAGSDIDPFQPSPVMKELVNCLRTLIPENQGSKPTLILNGDILDLALTEDNEAAMVFERFIELIMPEDGRRLFDKIIFIPGNHDHHLWETARETQYVNFIKTINPGKYLPVPWHTTNMFVENTTNPVPSFFLTKLIQRYNHLKEFEITTVYPNFGLIRADFKKCVIFHHGHYIESLYQAMSYLRDMIFPDRRKPEHVWDIEAENFAWIDFFWSTLGRSGGVGRDVELIYEKMQDKEQFKKILYNLADSLAEKYDVPLIPGDWLEKKVLRSVLGGLADKIYSAERKLTYGVLSKDSEEGLKAYIEGPLMKQIISEQNGNVTGDVTFVFGHTHKPFQGDMNFRDYPEWVKVYNTGGWVVESVDPEPLRGGAVVLADDDLNTVSLRMYTEDNYTVRVEQATHAGEEHNPLFDEVNRLVDSNQEPWRSFSVEAGKAVSVRARNLKDRINSRD